MGMGIVVIPRNSWDSRRDGNKIVRDSRGNVTVFDFYGAPAATKICFQTVE